MINTELRQNGKFDSVQSEGDVQLSVVIPTYNESGNVRILCEELHQALSGRYSYEIIFVDDGSTDGSKGELHDLWREGRASVLTLRRNFGQSSAMAAGIAAARGKIIATMDADLQNDPNDLPALIGMLDEGYDVVCGWRKRRKDSFSKRILSKGANWLRSRLTNEPVHDSGCTLRVYRRECMEEMSLQGEMHRFVPSLLYSRGYQIGELKVNHRFRQFGKSKYGLSRVIRGLLDLLLVAFWQKFSFRPIHLFGVIGGLIAMLSLGVTGFLIVDRLFFGTPLSDRPLFLFGLFGIIFGAQFFALGIITDVLMKIYFVARRQPSYSVKEFLK